MKMERRVRVNELIDGANPDDEFDGDLNDGMDGAPDGEHDA